MSQKTTLEAARQTKRWWGVYYHLLLALHFFLGVSGVLVGALIAADFQSGMFAIESKVLGIISTIIVGIVFFIQPGRMASVFYDAYWRLHIEILKASEKQQESQSLLEGMANGYGAVAAIQPEAINRGAMQNETEKAAD